MGKDRAGQGAAGVKLFSRGHGWNPAEISRLPAAPTASHSPAVSNHFSNSNE